MDRRLARSNLVPTFRANWFAGDSPVGDFSEAIQIFNANPTSMSYWAAIDYGPYVVGMNNGNTEVWPYLEVTDADIFTAINSRPSVLPI